MADPKDSKSSLFQKVMELGHATLNSQIQKAKTTIHNSKVETEVFQDKAVVDDPTYANHSQGWKERATRLSNVFLKQMSYQDSMIASVIQTRQSQVANHANLVKSKVDKGWMIELRDEDALLEKIKDELRAGDKNKKPGKAKPDATPADDANPDGDVAENIGQDADETLDKAQDFTDETSSDDADTSDVKPDAEDQSDDSKSDDEVEAVDWELERKARQKLNKKFESARKRVEEYIKNCGLTDNRPFESKSWNFEKALRAMVRDSLTYDLHAEAVTPDKAGRPHHWFPVDGGTIQFASDDLKNYKDLSNDFIGLNILDPENPDLADKREAIELDPKLLEAGMYRYVQVIRNRIESAFTESELKVGIRNANTDIYNVGYGLSELELLVSMVTGHINAEYYNQAYFTQGFSAKGILHIKKELNKRDLDTVRMRWQHLMKGAKNSFNTPIFAGMDDVQWIPLTQNHNDIGFEGWMRYLATMICAIYQIDPSELGMNFKAEGSGGSLGGQNAQKHKQDHSKDKGLYPLLKHFETHISEEIIKPFDARFKLKFTGLDEEDRQQALERQEKEVKFKKTVNEIRAEDGLAPLPGMDAFILDPTFLQWFTTFSDEGKAKAKEDQKTQQNSMQMQNEHEQNMGAANKPEEPKNTPDESIYGADAFNPDADQPDPFKKSFKPLTIEIYKIEK
jgi:hypothetical protein